MSFDYGGMSEHQKRQASKSINPAFAGVPEELHKRVIFLPSRRVRINWVGIAVNIVSPWLLFTGLMYVMTFDIHYQSPTLAWSLVAAGIGLAAVMAWCGYNRKYEMEDGKPAWFIYAAGAFFFASVFAAAFGNWVFALKMNSYFDLHSMNTYSGVNPMRVKGAMVSDAGRAYFSMNAHLDQKKAIAFKHMDTYCAVPITVGDDKLPNYDFWAVGMNCCDEGKFHCGADWDNFRARSALRLMDLDQAPFYRLAVQQAEAAYDISANHPVFFHWTQDPVKDINDRKHFALKMFFIGSGTYFIANFCAVVYATFAFAKMTN
jgi:hypothetical protein